MKGVNLTMANAQTVVLTTKHAQDTKVSEIDTSKLLTFVLFLLLWLKICPACANDLEAKGTRSRKLLPKPQNHQVRRENIKIPTNDSQPYCGLGVFAGDTPRFGCSSERWDLRGES